MGLKFTGSFNGLHNLSYVNPHALKTNVSIIEKPGANELIGPI